MVLDPLTEVGVGMLVPVMVGGCEIVMYGQGGRKGGQDQEEKTDCDGTGGPAGIFEG